MTIKNSGVISANQQLTCIQTHIPMAIIYNNNLNKLTWLWRIMFMLKLIDLIKVAMHAKDWFLRSKGDRN